MWLQNLVPIAKLKLTSHLEGKYWEDTYCSNKKYCSLLFLLWTTHLKYVIHVLTSHTCIHLVCTHVVIRWLFPTMMQSEIWLGREVLESQREIFHFSVTRNFAGDIFVPFKGTLVALCHDIVLRASECLTFGTRLATPAARVCFLLATFASSVLATIHHMQQDSTCCKCPSPLVACSRIIWEGGECCRGMFTAVSSLLKYHMSYF